MKSMFNRSKNTKEIIYYLNQKKFDCQEKIEKHLNEIEELEFEKARVAFYEVDNIEQEISFENSQIEKEEKKIDKLDILIIKQKNKLIKKEKPKTIELSF